MAMHNETSAGFRVDGVLSYWR